MLAAVILLPIAIVLIGAMFVVAAWIATSVAFAVIEKICDILGIDYFV